MSKSGMAEILPATALTGDETLGWMEQTYFYGHMHLKDDKLVFTLKPAWQEDTGYKEIVFEKIGEYPLPHSSSSF